MQELILEKVLELLQDSASDYIPQLEQLQNDMRTMKKSLETDMKQIRQQQSMGGSSQTEDMSRFEFETLRRNLQQTDQILTDKLNHLQKDLDDSLNKIFGMFANNPLNGRMDSVEQRLPNYITQERFNAMQEAMLDLASTSSVEHIVNRLNKLHEKFLTRDDYESLTESLVREIDEKLAEKLGPERLNEELDNYDADIQDRIDEVSKQIDNAKKGVKKLQVDFMDVIDVTNNQTELLKQKVDFDEIERLWKNFEKYSLYEDLKDLYMKTVPEIYKFEQKIEEHRRDIEK